MLEELRREAGFQLLVAHEETGTGVTYARDRRVRKWAREAGVEFVELPQSGVIRRLHSRNGWNRLWENRMQSPAAVVRRTDGRGSLDVVRRLADCGRLTSQALGAMQQDPVRRHLERESPTTNRTDSQHYFSFFTDDGPPPAKAE